MKLIIGASGHWNISKEATDLDPSLEITAFAPGCTEEDVSCLKNALPAAQSYTDWREMIEMALALYPETYAPYTARLPAQPEVWLS